MGELIKKEDSALVRKLHQRDALSITKPYEREIFLFDTFVAGTTHIDEIERLEPHIKVGDKLCFFREPENPYDDEAIVIKTEDGVKVGYIPRQDNDVFARLMDAGKQLYGKVKGKEMRGKWLRMPIEIYLRD